VLWRRMNRSVRVVPLRAKQVSCIDFTSVERMLRGGTVAHLLPRLSSSIHLLALRAQRCAAASHHQGQALTQRDSRSRSWSKELLELVC
jgi:hypothetical protein